jgi:hypothetical protein
MREDNQQGIDIHTPKAVLVGPVAKEEWRARYFQEFRERM